MADDFDGGDAGDGGGLWDGLINEGREFLDGTGSEDFMDTLHEMYGLDPGMAYDAICEMTDSTAERHELYTAMLYE